MASAITRHKITWKIENIARENIRRGFIYDDIEEYTGFESDQFNCYINGENQSRWQFYIVAGCTENYCNFTLSKRGGTIPDVSNFWIKLMVSIQSDGVVKEIKSDSKALKSTISVAFCWHEFINIEEIFDAHLSSDNSLTFIIDLVITNNNSKLDGSLQSLCTRELIKQISIENVLDLLYYADRCKAKILEDQCLDFIAINHDKIKENEEKWKNVNARLMSKIMEAISSMHIIILNSQRFSDLCPF